MPHPVTWIELPSTDPRSTQAFYRDVFGWQIKTDRADQYAEFDAGNGLGGGIYPVVSMPAQGGITVYILVDSLAVALEQIVAHGGQSVGRAEEVPGGGHIAYFKDPAGNRLGLYEVSKK
jgi:hypothetical protein